MNDGDSNEDRYTQSLAPKDLLALDIAKSYLGMSFCLEKSNGFLAWKKEDNLKRKFVADVPFSSNKKR